METVLIETGKKVLLEMAAEIFRPAANSIRSRLFKRFQTYIDWSHVLSFMVGVFAGIFLVSVIVYMCRSRP